MGTSNMPGLRPFQNRGLFADDFQDLNTGLPLDEDDRGNGGPAQGGGTAPSPTLSYATGGGTGGIKAGATIQSGATAAAASPFVINIAWGSSVSTAPAAFKTDVNAAVAYLQGQFTDNVTLTVNVGYGECGGYSIGTALGANLSNATTVSYAGLVAALTADKKSVADANVVSSLPATTPIAGATYWVATAQAKALGLAAPGGADGSIGFGASTLFTYGATATSGTIKAGTYDFFATVLHELTELMGRRVFTGTSQGGYAGSYTAMDLLHYSAAGVRDLSATTPGYLSVDGGKTSLGALNTAAGGDAGDWASTVLNDPFDAFAPAGALATVSNNDLTVMDALGWDRVGATPASVSQPLGVAFAANSSALSSIQGSSGLNNKTALATATQTGGATADTYTYTLGGTGAGSFSIATQNNTGILSTGTATVAGAAGGKLYALTVTATDTSSAKSTAAAPVNVVVGTSSADTINAGSIAGIVASAPTFIYGLAGTDSISASGLTGSALIVGGGGADKLTGGSGANRYAYAAASDSSVSAADIVSNFKPALDVIDLVGLGTKLPNAAALASGATAIAGNSIGWLATTVSGAAHTMVYVNTTGGSQALTAASMKIDLVGNIALTGANFAHN